MMNAWKVNLLKETEEVLARQMLTFEDVQWIGSGDGKFSMSVERFKKLADFTYDYGYGAQVVEPTLVIVGEGWWLERAEYDGLEWWEFKRKPELNSALSTDLNIETLRQIRPQLFGDTRFRLSGG